MDGHGDEYHDMDLAVAIHNPSHATHRAAWGSSSPEDSVVKITFISIMALVLAILHTPTPVASAGGREDLTPTSCETNAALLSRVQGSFRERSNDDLVIVIAHLGQGETSEKLNNRRLYNVSHYLKSRLGFEPSRIVTAQGEKLSGYARVKIYVGGKLQETLIAERNKDLCVTCCGPDDEFFLIATRIRGTKAR